MSQSGSARAPLGRVGKIGVGFLAIGAGLAAIGLRVGGPSVGGAVAAFGAAATLAGLHSVTTRQHREGYESSNLIRDHSGTAAVLLGTSFIVPGVAMVVGGLASALGFADGLWGWVEAHPAWAVIGSGIWIGLYGLGLLISRWSYAEASTAWWQRLPGQLVGVWVIAMGGAVIAAGWSLALEPANPREAAERFGDWFLGLVT